MRISLIAVTAAALLSVATLPAFAVDANTPASSQAVTAQNYRFELAGSPRPAGVVQHVISVRLVRAADNKPVSGAVIVQTRLDMSPENMAAKTAPVKLLPATIPGIYSFAVDNGAVWKWTGKWALTLTANVQGVPQTVRGRVVFQVEP